MGCIYNGVCSSLVTIFLRQQATNLAAVDMGDRYGSLSKLGLFLNS